MLNRFLTGEIALQHDKVVQAWDEHRGAIGILAGFTLILQYAAPPIEVPFARSIHAVRSVLDEVAGVIFAIRGTRGTGKNRDVITHVNGANLHAHVRPGE